MDVIKMIKTIKKLKAGVSALIENNQSLISKTKFIYMKDTAIYTSEEEKDQNLFKSHENYFYTFMDRDEKHMLDEINQEYKTETNLVKSTI